MIIRKIAGGDRRRWRRPAQILARCLAMLRGEGAPGRHDRRARRGGREVHPLAGRRAGLQGLPRLPGLDLRLAELDGRPRDPGPVQARARATSSRSTSAWCSTAGSRTRAVTVADRPGHARWRAKLLKTTRESLFEAVEQCRAGQPPGRRLPRGPAAGRGGRLLGDPLAGRATGSGARCTRIRRSRTSASPARGPMLEEGMVLGDRADGQRRRPRGPDGRRTTGRSTRRTARWPPISSTRSPSPRTGPRILTPWHSRGGAARAALSRRPDCTPAAGLLVFGSVGVRASRLLGSARDLSSSPTEDRGVR